MRLQKRLLDNIGWIELAAQAGIQIELSQHAQIATEPIQRGFFRVHRSLLSKAHSS
jgi:hypothetical protein